eukprot:tig00020531_g10060.t1
MAKVADAGDPILHNRRGSRFGIFTANTGPEDPAEAKLRIRTRVYQLKQIKNLTPAQQMELEQLQIQLKAYETKHETPRESPAPPPVPVHEEQGEVRPAAIRWRKALSQVKAQTQSKHFIRIVQAAVLDYKALMLEKQNIRATLYKLKQKKVLSPAEQAQSQTLSNRLKEIENLTRASVLPRTLQGTVSDDRRGG